jgi:hypothetical protein
MASMPDFNWIKTDVVSDVRVRGAGRGCVGVRHAPLTPLSPAHPGTHPLPFRMQGRRAFGFSEGVGTFTGDFYGYVPHHGTRGGEVLAGCRRRPWGGVVHQAPPPTAPPYHRPPARSIKATGKRAPIRFIARYEFGSPAAPLAVTNMVVTSSSLEWLRTVGVPLSLPGLRAAQPLAPQAVAGQKIVPQAAVAAPQQQAVVGGGVGGVGAAGGLPAQQQGLGALPQQGFASGGLPHTQLPRY